LNYNSKYQKYSYYNAYKYVNVYLRILHVLMYILRTNMYVCKHTHTHTHTYNVRMYVLCKNYVL